MSPPPHHHHHLAVAKGLQLARACSDVSWSCYQRQGFCQARQKGQQEGEGGGRVSATYTAPSPLCRSSPRRLLSRIPAYGGQAGAKVSQPCCDCWAMSVSLLGESCPRPCLFTPLFPATHIEQPPRCAAPASTPSPPQRRPKPSSRPRKSQQPTCSRSEAGIAAAGRVSTPLGPPRRHSLPRPPPGAWAPGNCVQSLCSARVAAARRSAGRWAPREFIPTPTARPHPACRCTLRLSTA